MMRILIVDDDAMFRLCLTQGLLESSITHCALEAESIDAARQLIHAEHNTLNLVLLDYILPDGDGLSFLKELRSAYPTLAIAMISAHEDYDLMQSSIEMGALGFIPKNASFPVLTSAITLILAGGVYIPPSLYAMERTHIGTKLYNLTSRQDEVLDLIRQGLCNKKIASTLDICEATVKAHITVILKSRGFSSRTQLLNQIH